jgi:2-hydroxychromene-2-carboxylate isomerase
VPVLLGGIFKLTNNKSPVEAYASVRNKLAYQRLETERFVRRHRITRYEFNPFFPVNTLALMRGAIAAKNLNVFTRYVTCVFDNMWATPRKMDDPGVASAALNAAGLDAKQIFDLTQDPAVKSELLANTESSVQRGAFGIPTFFVGDEIYFGKDRLSEVEEAIRQGN